jgi:hypothetical protein
MRSVAPREFSQFSFRILSRELVTALAVLTQPGHQIDGGLSLPRTAFIAAILLTGYLGGPVATHVRVSDPFFIPIVIDVVAWFALGLRDPRVFTLAFKSSVQTASSETRNA